MEQNELAIITRLLGSDVKKPTALVHFQRQMSQVAQRIMTLLIFNTQETEADIKGNYEIRAKFVHDFLGWTESKNYERIYEAFRDIKRNDIVWNFMGEDRTLDELHC
ncbi:MAG: RepB family plasmid replication initiator protein [Magnetospirillum sp.]|nr:MAG: RepB family plasmid replication initiator protein [Magnetospirillum sp.]